LTGAAAPNDDNDDGGGVASTCCDADLPSAWLPELRDRMLEPLPRAGAAAAALPMSDDMPLAVCRAGAGAVGATAVGIDG
jgi:hypothetical protein